MFKWLFKPKDKHIHQFGKWEVIARYTSTKHAIVKLEQQRICSECGYTEIHMQEVY
mgnify:CR=1 FL=1